MARPWQHGPDLMQYALALLSLGVVVLRTVPAGARAADEPIRLAWAEGDIGGMSSIYAAEGDRVIGFVEYRQHRENDVLSAVRVARFSDGSSDEDQAVARVGGTLEAVSGRSIVREPDGQAVVDVTIDVAGGRLTGSYGRGAERRTIDEQVKLPAATYWGPLVFLVLKNFEANAENGRVRFRTVAPTPKPMVLEMELVQLDASAPLLRLGTRLETRTYELRPNIHWTVDPVVHLVAPKTRFWVLPGAPPALARYTGPRNYGRQSIQIQ